MGHLIFLNSQICCRRLCSGKYVVRVLIKSELVIIILYRKCSSSLTETDLAPWKRMRWQMLCALSVQLVLAYNN